MGGRHDEVGAHVRDTSDETARRRISGHDRDRAALEHGHRLLALIESQPRLPILRVGTVAGKAAVREERPDVPVEIDAGLGSGDRDRGGEDLSDDDEGHPCAVRPTEHDQR